MKPILLFSLLVVATFAISCGPIGGGSYRDFASDYVIHLDENASSGFRATLPDGTVFTDPESYARYAPIVAQRLVNEGRTAAFVVDEQSCNGFESPSSDYGSSSQCLRGGSSLPFGYYFSFEISGSKRINGCVNTVCNPGGAVRLHRNGNQLWDMHVGRFIRNGRACLGMYESQSGWCINPCGPNSNDLKQGLRDAAIAVGVAATSAWLMAQAMGPVLENAIGTVPL